LVERVGEIIGLSRAIFEAREGMTDGREVAAEVTNEVRQRTGFALDGKPGEERAPGRASEDRVPSSEHGPTEIITLLAKAAPYSSRPPTPYK
jgi:hypothetical protein